MGKQLILLVVVLTMPLTSNADSVYDPPPQPYVLASDFGPIYMTMLPIGYGIAYKLLVDGTSKELWHVNSYFNKFQGTAFLSGDGQHLIRVASAIRPGHGPFDEVAIEFYKSGVLFKTYSISDLVKNASKIEHSVSHYRWRSIDSNYPQLKLLTNTKFYLRTIDEIRYWFDITSGEIIEINSP